jgi:hypothetical protein
LDVISVSINTDSTFINKLEIEIESEISNIEKFKKLESQFEFDADKLRLSLSSWCGNDHPSLDRFLKSVSDEYKYREERFSDYNLFLEILANAKFQLKSKKNLLVENNKKNLTIKNFNVIQAVSKGAFAKVYVATTPLIKPNKYVAIKVMEKSLIYSKNMNQTIVDEVNIMAELYNSNNGNINSNKGNNKFNQCFVKFYSSFQTAEYLFISMEFLPGGDLLTLINKKKKLSEIETKFIMSEVTQGVLALHERGY